MEYDRKPMTTTTRGGHHGFGSRSVFDGVFADDLPSNKRAAEDYSDIFRGSGGSTIPVLDVPELEERRISKSSNVDYSKIFGGFGDAEFGVSHEQLFKHETNSSNEQRNPVSSSQGSSHSHRYPAKQVSPSGEVLYKSFNGAKEFKMSYHKTDRGNETGTNGTMHIAQLHAIPGYSYVVDELNKTEEQKLVSTSKGNNLSGGRTQGRNHSKSVSEIPTFVQSAKSGVIYPNKTSRSRTNSVDMLFDAPEAVLRTPVLGMPPSSSHPYSFSNNNKFVLEHPVRFKSGVSKFSSFDSDVTPDSPPYFDTELDSNSVAAASAAAVRKAIEEAQEKLKIAKEIMERRKKGFQNHAKLKRRSSVEIEDEIIPDRRDKLRESGARVIREEIDDTPTQFFSRKIELNAVKAGTVTSNLQDSEEAEWRNFKSPRLDLEQEKPERCEDVNDVKNENKMKLPVSGYGHEEEKTIEENDKKFRGVDETPKQGVVARIFDAVKWAYELTDNAMKSESVVQVLDHKEHPPKLRVAQQDEEAEEELGTFHEVAPGGGKMEEDGQNEVETEAGVSQPEEQMVEELITASHEEGRRREMEYDRMQGVVQKEEETKSHKTFYGPETCSEKMKDLPKHVENEQKCEISKPECDEILNRLTDDEKEQNVTHNLVDHDARLECIHEKRHEEASQRMEVEREQTEACRLEGNDVEQEDFHNTEKRNEESSQRIEVEREERIEENDIEHKDVHTGDGGTEKRVRKVWGQNIVTEIFTNFHDTDESEEESFEEDVENDELAETGSVHQESYQLKRVEEKHEEACDWVKTNFFSRIIDQREDDKTQEALSCCGNNLGEANCRSGQDEFECEEAASEAHVHGASFECNRNINRLKAVELADILEVTELREKANFSQHWLEVNDIEKQVRDAWIKDKVYLGATDLNIERKQHNQLAENSVDRLVGLVGKNNAYIKENKITIKQEEHNKFESSSEEESDGQTEGPTSYEDKVENAEISNEMKTTVKENEARDSKEPENEHVRKIDEEKGREREKEKERVVVERAIREARERAFAEARERATAKRSNAEVHRRAVAENSNDKSSAEKASVETKRKAERAAVERATAEARERALVKALLEKKSAQPRKQAENPLRNTGLGKNVSSNGAQYKNSGSRNPNPCDHNERFEVANGEPAEVCNARLERNQRTAERAAKALAEKNMRDLLVQKEQAERDRLANSLDGEIKRWSSGKEGNLRALLSTLQYILGPNSGWQATPLTDLIATTAVRKAYRRATLFVHPDKLQQRGATTQQKYICEKVFDLLKDAWNKFSTEER